MKRVRTLTVCVAALAMALAAGTESASAAQPTFTTALVGKLSATTLTATSQTGVKETVICKKGGATGEISGASTFAETVKLEECKSGTTACGNAAAETIETNRVSGELYYVNKAETTPGAVTGNFLTSFKCGTENVEDVGILIGSISNTATGFSLKYVVTGGKQADQFFFNEGSELGPFTLVSEPVHAESTLKTTETVTETVQA